MQNKYSTDQQLKTSLKFQPRNSPQNASTRFNLSPRHGNQKQGKKINILDLSTKITEMENKIKDKHKNGLQGPTSLYNTTNGEELRLRRAAVSPSNDREKQREEEQKKKPKVLNLEQLRTTWDEGSSITLKVEDGIKSSKKITHSPEARFNQAFA